MLHRTVLDSTIRARPGPGAVGRGRAALLAEGLVSRMYVCVYIYIYTCIYIYIYICT